MESVGGLSFSDMKQTMRKKRSDRRPRNDIQVDYNENSSLSSSPPSEDNTGHKNILNLNQCHSMASYTNLTDAEKALNVVPEFGTQESSDSKDASEVFASNYKDTKHDHGHISNAKEVDNVVKKVKLKVGGVVRTLHAKPSSDDVANASSSSSRLKIGRENSEEDYSSAQDKGSGLRGIPWKDFSRSGFSVGKVDSSRHTIAEESICIDKSESIRKRKRVPKRHLLDASDNDDNNEDDAEMRYLEKMKSKPIKIDDEDEGGRKKQRRISSVLKMESFGSSRPKTRRGFEDTDYIEEEEEEEEEEERVLSNAESQIKSKKQRKDFGKDSSREMTVTTRRQALHGSTDSTTSLVEFPNGLPPAPPRKQKDKPSEVEHQLKKAEAAQRRKMQAAKAARESEEEAIRKILGQDSSRKKRENKMKQRQEELAQEKASNAAILASNTVRWVIGPSGTVVTFSDDLGLPNIFESRPCSYPLPREKCAGPSCSKPFKYRDSRSKLPLCSLQCYKAVHEKIQARAVC